MPPRPALLCILDGWGFRPDHAEDNAIAAAATPNYTRLLKECPHALLATSGNAVGLPKGQMGNSEVGHMNIGAGRIVARTCRASTSPSKMAVLRAVLSCWN